MMQPKSRKERVAKYGSFLFCPKKETLCSCLDNDDGICRQKPCYLEDPDYLKKQEQIRSQVRENARREREKREKEKHDHPAPIRRQTKTKEQILEEKIRAKEEKARRLYQTNKPKAADGLMREVMALRSQLRKMKGA